MRSSMLVLAVALVVPSVASAQDAQGQPPREQRFNFEEDVVTGTLVRPDSEIVTGGGDAKQTSLIRIRQDFIQEMVESVEQL